MSRSAVEAHKRREAQLAAGSDKSSLWRWLGFAIPILAIIALVVVGVVSSGPDEAVVSTPAPDFTLPATNGSVVSLSDALAQGDVLLYFSMGVGCDGCFAQIPEIRDELADQGVAFLPIMVDPIDLVAGEASRFGISTPILIDNSRQVSAAYGMLGVYGHADRPSHSFALVGQDGTIKWVRHYATMFVPAREFMQELAANL